jgi:hypothetical protein
MKSPIEFFDPILLSNMAAALDAVLARCMPMHAASPGLRIALGRLIIDSARGGERDPSRLELSALSGLPDATTLGTRLPQAHRSSS